MSDIKRIKPLEAAHYLKEKPGAVLLDVRSQVEYAYVGHPVGSICVPWKEAPEWTVNPNFVDEVRRRIPESRTPILLLCRSGQRSLDAAMALEAAGYSDLTNIEEGFEGALDENKHRGNLGGWRFHGLPWEQS